MKQCPKCKNNVSDTAKFCVKCGCNIKKYEEEQMTYFCPECGTKFSGGKFCPECGFNIEPEINKKPKKIKNDIDLTEIDRILDDKLSKVKEKESFASFEYEKYINGGYFIKKFIDPIETNVVLPESVVGIKDGAFENSLIISIKLNEGLKIIGKKAFANCKYLEKINIPSSVSRIDDEAFKDCVKLDVVIPNTVKIQGSDILKNTLPEILYKEKLAKEKALMEKKALEEAKRKEREKKALEEKALKEAKEKALKEEQEKLEAEKRRLELEKEKKEIEAAIKKEQENGIYRIGHNKTVINKDSLIFKNNTTKKITVHIYNGVNEIASRTFENAKIQSLIMPDSIRLINERAFYNSYIEQIQFSKNITYLSSYAFENSHTKNITLPEKLKQIHVGCFKNSKELLSVTTSVETIYDNAFENCSYLKTVNFKSRVKAIGKSAFKNCNYLRDINLENAEIIKEECFRYCNNLENVVLGPHIQKIESYAFAQAGIKNLTISGYPEIMDAAFLNCNKLEKITIQNAVKKISKSCFESCENLREVILPSSLIEIGERAFWGCKHLEKITIPSSVKKIGASAFALCDNLKEIVIQSYSLEIGNNAFYACDNLEKANISGTSIISDACFGFCKKLKEIKLPSNLLEIGRQAFIECTSLEKIMLPNSVKKVGVDAFVNCSCLKEITLSSGLVEIYGGTFEKCSSLRNINLPSGCLKYRSIDGNLYEVDGIYLSLIQYCEGKKDTIYRAPNNVKTIRKDAARSAVNLESVILPNVTYINESAFEYCNKIQNVQFGPNLERIGDSAFRTANLKIAKLPKKCNWYSTNSFPSSCVIKKV